MTPTRHWLWIVVGGAMVLLAVSRLMADGAADGLYFHGWSSEDLVHTAPLADLKAEPLRTLWWLHAFPPGLDVMRALASWPWPTAPLASLVRQTDQVLLVVWAIQYGLLCAVVWQWLRELRGPGVAWTGMLLWAASPGALSFATLLDTTQLTALLVTTLTWTVWRTSERPDRSLAAYIAAMIGLFFVRALVQWPMFLIGGLALRWVGVARRRAVTATTVLLVVAGLWGVKQYTQFGWWTSSTVVGANLARSIGISDEGYFDLPPLPTVAAEDARAAVRTTRLKHGGMTNLNHEIYVERNAALLTTYLHTLTTMTWRELAGSYWRNVIQFLRPVGDYSDNTMIAGLPWRSAFDAVWSGRALAGLCAAACGWWVFRHRRAPREAWRRACGVALPVAAFAVAAVLGEKDENMRLRFFIDPVLWVWIVSAVADACGYTRPASDANSLP